MMKISIKLFAIAREMTGKTGLQLELPEAATVETALANLREVYPKFAELNSFMVAINQEYAERTDMLHDGDELAIIPPVSGG